MTFTDEELDTLTAMLLQTDPSRIGYSGPKKYNRDGKAAADAITYLRECLKTVLDREAATHARHDSKIEALEARDPIGAVIMRERAAKWHSGIANLCEFDGDTRSSDLHSRYATAIRALPLPTRAEVLAYALKLPEVRALVASSAMAWQGLVAEYGHYKARVNFCELEDALDALAALEPKP